MILNEESRDGKWLYTIGGNQAPLTWVGHNEYRQMLATTKECGNIIFTHLFLTEHGFDESAVALEMQATYGSSARFHQVVRDAFGGIPLSFVRERRKRHPGHAHCEGDGMPRTCVECGIELA